MSDSTGSRFVVQWDGHPFHISSRLGQLLETQTLVDVTLVCNTHTLRVHRCVLAACSPYFENLLQDIAMRQLVHHPLIVLKDMQFSVLRCMIEFMYCGETNVTEEDLGLLLHAARFFQVKGLSSMTREDLGLLPGATTTIPKFDGEVVKRVPIAVSTPVSGKAPGMMTVSTQQPAVRESPGMLADSNDPAELLLSLSNPGNHAPKFLTQPSKQVSQPRSSRPAVDSCFHLPPNQPERAPPVYHPVPAKRGRPPQRPTNLIVQEKVIPDTERALQKEAEASRLAVEIPQKEMSSEETNVNNQQRIQSQQPQAQSAPKVQADSVKKSKHVSETSKVVASTPAAVPATTYTKVTFDEGDTSTYPISGPVMTRYMEALKDAGLPTDVPILMDSGDGNYVQVNEELLMNMFDGEELSYQIIAEESQDVHKQQEDEMVVTSGDEKAQVQQKQLVRYVNDNGDVVEEVFEVVQEGEGTTRGQVIQFQGETYQLMEGPAESNNLADLQPPMEQQLAIAVDSTNKRSSLDDASATKKVKLDASK